MQPQHGTLSKPSITTESFFEQVWVINIKRRPERLERFWKEIGNAFVLEFEFTKTEFKIVAIVRRSFTLCMGVVTFGFVACAGHKDGRELSSKNQGEEQVKIGRMNVYGQPPSIDYVIIEGVNTIVIGARHKGLTDDLRIYLPWEPDLTVGELFEKIEGSESRAYLISVIRSGSTIYSGSGDLDRHGRREWELEPGDVIKLDEEIF